MCTRNICACKRTRAMFPIFCHSSYYHTLCAICVQLTTYHTQYLKVIPFLYFVWKTPIYVFEKEKAKSLIQMKTFSVESEIELSHARMWRGHDLRHL